MKVAIDATPLLVPSAGVRNYMHHWLSALWDTSRGQQDTVVTYPPNVALPGALDHEKSSWRAAFELRLVQFCNIRGNPFLNLLMSHADLFHASQHAANMPRRMKITATAHDFSCWTTPQFHTPANIAATRRYGERVMAVCDGLIAVSEHTRRDAIEILKIPAERIRVIYSGVAEPFFAVTDEDARRVSAQYGLDRPYLLFVGCIEPRKNVANLVRAYRTLPDSLRRDVELVVAGPFGWAGEEVREMLRGRVQGVRYLKYVPEEDLPGLFRGAAALTYPSFYEGFGFPAAQAMAAGIPVIASNRSCLPEVVGDAGLLVDPVSVEEIAEAMRRLLASPELAQELGLRGKVRAGAFRWETCAAQSLEFFRDVAG